MSLTCPTCSTLIDPRQRCPSTRGIWRCVENEGHDGWHWADVGGAPAILRWTGRFAARGCPDRLSLDEWCEEPAGHHGPHRRNGVSWVLDDSTPPLAATPYTDGGKP